MKGSTGGSGVEPGFMFDCANLAGGDSGDAAKAPQCTGGPTARMTGRYRPGRGWKSRFCSRVRLLGRDVPGKPVAVDRTCGPGGEVQAGLSERSRLAQLWNLGIHQVGTRHV